MGNFNRGGGFGGKKRFNNDRGERRGGRSERPSMHQAVCSDCGKDCEVPFRPTGDKPVFCSDCFGKKRDSGNSRFENRSFDRPSFRDKQMFDAVCDKCGEDCEVPFRPTGDKPVFCSDCFGKGEKGGGNNAGSSDNYKKQFDLLNNKLDNIIKLLLPKALVEKTIKKEIPVVKSAKKTVEKKIKIKKVSAKKK
jgi:CxxC-x17-CxxC domain-containing protein